LSFRLTINNLSLQSTDFSIFATKRERETMNKGAFYFIMDSKDIFL